jgi:gas vesicle protein
MMILNKSKELKKALQDRDKCKTEFQETTQKVNGYLKEKVDAWKELQKPEKKS